MAISGFNPTTALPAAYAVGAPLGTTLPSAALPGIPLNGASAGAAEKPGLGTRLMNAMRSAIGELRGSTSNGLASQTLAMQTSLPMAATPVSVNKPAATGKPKFPNAKTWIDKSGAVREVGTGKVLKPAPGAAAAPAATQQPVAGPQLPANAAQVPGATVYSYDQNGNPVAPTMQQLGMTPTMLQRLEGMTGAVDPSGPQLNATNQTNVGLGTGLGMGMGLGSQVPVIGQPIGTVTAPTPASSGASTGGSQTVANENVFDSDSHSQGLGYGYGYGTGGWGLPFGGVATPAAPYGSSMLGGNANRWF